jgi:hypothetical protein
VTLSLGTSAVLGITNFKPTVNAPVQLQLTNNYFDAWGNFRFTKLLSPLIPQRFFRIQLP